MKGIRTWQKLFFAGFVVVILFTWLVEIFDLPHLLLNAPSTPINWKESILESGFTLVAMLFSWRVIRYYENQWLQATTELKRLAAIDDLTGALNRREFLLQLEKEFARAQRFNQKLTIALLDIDVFKSINDQHGHLIGDKVLQELTKIFQANVRQQDLVGRLGGDEFGVAFIETSRTEANKIAERIQKQWREIEIRNDHGQRIKVNFSMGIASITKRDKELKQCIRRADTALYNAKRKGRNRIELA